MLKIKKMIRLIESEEELVKMNEKKELGEGESEDDLVRVKVRKVKLKIRRTK